MTVDSIDVTCVANVDLLWVLAVDSKPGVVRNVGQDIIVVLVVAAVVADPVAAGPVTEQNIVCHHAAQHS